MTDPQGVTVVTGAASGIGRAVAEHLLSAGRSVAALDRNESGLASLRSSTNANVLTRVTDIANSDDLDAAFAEVAAQHGPIIATVAAAGVWTPGTVPELSDDQWNTAIAVNLTGTFLTARAAVRHLLAGEGGAFVAVASDAGVQGSQGCAAYIAAKHGVVGLVRSLALDFGAHGLRANAVCPGFVDTPMTEEIFRDAPASLRQARNSEVPIGRFAKASEVAAVIASVISPTFSFVNGATLLVDGGATAGYYTSTP